MSFIDGNREPDLFDLANLILNDGCPPEKELQLCQYQSEYSDDICHSCWYIRLIIEGQGGAYNNGSKDRWINMILSNIDRGLIPDKSDFEDD